MRRRGFTLLELTIYCFLLILLGFCVMQLFTMGRGAQSSTISSYVVSGQADTALRWLRRDLQETALVSLRTFPRSGMSEPPGCSMVSARQPSDNDNSQLNVSKYGAPLWTKQVFYTLAVPSGGRTGDVIRWERELSDTEKDFVPRPATLMPSALGSARTKRTLLHAVLAPNTKVTPLGGAPNYQSDQFGGLRVQFVQRTGGEAGPEVLTSVNPGDTTQPQTAADHTALVEVQFKILTADTGKPTLYSLKLRMHPRY